MHGQLLTLQDAAARTAMSVAWLRRLIARKAIPAVRLGRSVRVREEDLERLIQEGVRPTRGETR